MLSSLLMSLGLTGLSLGASDYVYLVRFFLAALGLEYMLVAVSRSEGCNITNNLFSEITVLTLGKHSSSGQFSPCKLTGRGWRTWCTGAEASGTSSRRAAPCHARASSSVLNATLNKLFHFEPTPEHASAS